jgi:hypothetical protein
MAWCLVKHRDNFTFLLSKQIFSNHVCGKKKRKKKKKKRNYLLKLKAVSILK